MVPIPRHDVVESVNQLVPVDLPAPSGTQALEDIDRPSPTQATPELVNPQSVQTVPIIQYFVDRLLGDQQDLDVVAAAQVNSSRNSVCQGVPRDSGSVRLPA